MCAAGPRLQQNRLSRRLPGALHASKHLVFRSLTVPDFTRRFSFSFRVKANAPSLQSPECAGPSFRPQTIMASQFRLEMCSLSVDLSAVLEPVAELRIHNIAMQPAHYTPSSPSTKHPPYYRTFATPTSQTHPASATSVDAPQSSCRRLLTHVIQSHCASLENPI